MYVIHGLRDDCCLAFEDQALDDRGWAGLAHIEALWTGCMDFPTYIPLAFSMISKRVQTYPRPTFSKKKKKKKTPQPAPSVIIATIHDTTAPSGPFSH